ncbi:hypothetical protein AK812_SmicGene24882 [Symbiodinium microadriaticum]|uniref:Uncharacterized protein n=1 Tax=Symbiodinium microadriaticum TaxID=2951 RepID=A0A1Q9DDC9_SYMMI|nr:hypothetical protein AK812_SmicGene24882 [Symbiodinium microadriaticum]
MCHELTDPLGRFSNQESATICLLLVDGPASQHASQQQVSWFVLEGQLGKCQAGRSCQQWHIASCEHWRVKPRDHLAAALRRDEAQHGQGHAQNGFRMLDAVLLILNFPADSRSCLEHAMEKPVALLLALAAMFLWGSWANTLLLSRTRFELLGARKLLADSLVPSLPRIPDEGERGEAGMGEGDGD